VVAEHRSRPPVFRHRQLQGLVSCQVLGTRPNCIPRSRLKGSALRGLTYEKKVGKFLKTLFPDLHSGQWFSYVDASGHGYCQVDHYAVLANQVLLVECKLTETPVGFAQIKDLYRPVLEQRYGLPVTGVQAARHLVSRRNLILNIRDALQQPGRDFLWHHLC
jgi:hypothetical protein